MTLDAQAVVQRLRERYKSPEWELAVEVGDSTGFSCRRHLDALAVGCWPSKGLNVLGFEIKVSRADWLHELAQPIKRAEFEASCNEFWFVCAKGVAAR